MRSTTVAGSAATRPANTDSGIILVATDGESQSLGALAAAGAFAARLDARVQPLAVNWPKAFITAEAPLIFDPYLESARRAELLRRARAQATPYAGSQRFRATEVRDGDPPAVIATVAADRQAQLVICGLGRHQIVDRLFGDETALRLVRVSRVPVLAVPESFPRDFSASPRRAVVGIDFSEGSIRAAQAVSRLLPPGSTIELLYVMPQEQDLGYGILTPADDERSIAHDFAALRDRLTIPTDVRIEERTAVGNAGVELLGRAQATNADMVAVGSHGYGFLARIVVGSVTTAILRRAGCAVLVVPPEAASGSLGSDIRKADGAGVDHSTLA